MYKNYRITTISKSISPMAFKFGYVTESYTCQLLLTLPHLNVQCGNIAFTLGLFLLKETYILVNPMGLGVSHY